MGLRQRLPRRQLSRQASDALLAVPLGLIVTIVLADVLSPRGVPLGPLLIVAPAITASFAGPVLTGVMGGTAVAALLGIGLAHENLLGTLYFDSQIIALLVVSVIVTVFRYLQVRHDRELTQVRTVSEVTQNVVMRPLPRRIGPLRVASMYLAAQEHAMIGGDLYAAVRTPTGTRLIIGDARGKGLTAISDAALLLGAFREAAHREATLPALMSYLEHSVCWNLAEPAEAETAGECFITAAVLDIPDKSAQAQMVTCGHPPPLLLRHGQATALSAPRPAPPLGLGGLSRPDYRIDTFTLEPDDVLLLHTDGLTEARDAQGVFYPLAERAAAWTDESPPALIRRLRTDLLAYVGGHLADDAAVIALQHTRSQFPTEPDRRVHEPHPSEETATTVRRGVTTP
ncbi:serine/threonine-protein phosphatase [Streptomyces sp. NBC_00378]|nr:serine/threonine-protein phosphatase [Streptomyces sp. NBC_00378]